MNNDKKHKTYIKKGKSIKKHKAKTNLSMTKASRPMGGPPSTYKPTLFKKGTAKKTVALNTTIKTGLPTSNLKKRTTAPRTKIRKGFRSWFKKR
jgi:hypothetical protein